MYIDLEPIFHQEGICVPIDTEFTTEDDVISSPVHVKGTVRNKTGVVRIDAAASYVGNARYARCDRPFSFDATVPVEHIFLSDPAQEENDLYIVVDDFRLDLDSLVLEDVFLAMPFRFLCREDCKGLCPVCGADLNEGSCGCRPSADPRWDALKDLF